MRRHLKLILLFIRATVQVQLEYRSGVFGRTLASMLSTGTTVLLLWAMFRQVKSIGGWTFDQALVLIGVVTTIDYVVEIWLYPSLSKITGYVQRGEFDVLLLKPVSSQFLVTFRYLQVMDVIGLLVGLAIIGTGMYRTESFDALNLPLLAIFLVAALVIIYSLYLALSTLAFWFTRIEEVASLIWLHSTAGSFPVTAYPPWARFIFTFIVPVAFVTNVPAEAATGRLSWEWGLGSLAFATLVFCGATWLWSLAIRNYSSASS
ncbi:MAG: ABC-2 family transporter protein [Dongiaceae bacterium]